MQIHNVEQRSDAWHKLRCGIPTASEFSKIVTSSGKASKSVSGYARTLAAEAFAGRPVDVWEGNAWTERGREMESRAIKLYGFTRDVDVEPVGFVTDNAGTIGCSPDGFVGSDGLIEIKCLKAENHINAILYFQKHARCLPKYVQQTQGQIQMMICERSWCDLVFYHPELPMLVIRQEPDRTVQMALLAGIPKLYAERDRVLAVIRQQGEPPPAMDATDTDALREADVIASRLGSG